LFKLWLDKEQQSLVQKDVLHFAPEHSLASLVRPLARRYRSADIAPGRADLVLNIERLALEPDSVEAVICAHVLEHVDDGKALRELFRILRPGGLVVISVPIIEGWSVSYENPAIVTAGERALHFGQWDHVRYYGTDLRDRISSAGFSLEEFTASPEEVVRHGLIRGDKLFLARKPG
jgi:SAM-dependent methyltransferase